MTLQVDSDQNPPPFLQAALAALDHYAIHTRRLVFLQHNSGVTYRLDGAAGERCLVKLHLSINGEHSSPSQTINSRMQWLADIHQKTGLAVQAPVQNRQGQWVTQIHADAVDEPVSCTVQQWVEGDPPHGHFTPEQLSRLGQLMARFHAYSSQAPDFPPALPSYSPAALAAQIQVLHQSVGFGILSQEEFAQIERIQGSILPLIVENRDDPSTWGAIHGDIHHNNVLIHQGDMRVIDFDSMVFAPYIFDLGVTLYHIWYQGLPARQVFLDGYRQNYPLPTLPGDWIQTCVAWAAIDNLAFQITIPQQRAGQLLKKNLQQLVHEFCAQRE